MAKKDTKEVRDLIRGKLNKWMKEAGYESVSAFCRQTKIKVSIETVNRTLEGRGNSMPSPWILFLIMHKLNVHPRSIQEVLIEAGDEDLHKFIGSGPALEAKEDAILSSIKKCVSKRRDVEEDIVSNVKTWGKVAGVDLTREIAIMETM